MLNSWIVLIPPLLVLAIAFTTKQILWALAFGILSAGCIAGQFSLGASSKIIGTNLLDQITCNNFYIFTFLTALGILITLMGHTGGTAAYGNIIRGYITNKKSTQFASMLLSILLIFDDFFSSITTGCIMRPLTDRFKIPRIKLAYLIDSMAAPLVIAIPISSWTATLTMQLSKAGLSTDMSEKPLIYGDPFFAYVESIPFIFYTFLILISTFFIVHKGISYGTMYEHEKIAEETGNLFGGKKPKESNISYCPNQNGSLIDFIAPIALLIGLSFFILLYKGGYHLFGGRNSLLIALRETDIFYALCFGSVSALLTSIILFISRKKMTLASLPQQLLKGSTVMLDSIIILFLAWTFSDLLIQELHSGSYLAHLVVNFIPTALLPAIFFILTAISSIAIGSSWGTIAVMLPLAIPMVVEMSGIIPPAPIGLFPLLFPVIGAIFAGAIGGDHVSPLSSTTVMSSTSSGAYHHDHVLSQLEYAAPVFITCTLSYIITGYTIHLGFYKTIALSYGVGIPLCLGIHLFLNYRNKSTHH